MPSSAGAEAGAAMEISINKSDLLKELTATQGVVERKTTIPILSNFLFEAADGKLTITATDLDLSLKTSCAAKVKKEGAGTVPAKKLLDYVRLLPDSDLTIKFLDNHWASLTCGRSKTKMAGMSRESFPELPQMPEATNQIATTIHDAAYLALGEAECAPPSYSARLRMGQCGKALRRGAGRRRLRAGICALREEQR